MKNPLGRAFPILAFALLCATASYGQSATEPADHWIAGRYDGNRVIIYFKAVQFGGTLPSSTSKIAGPVTGFGQPIKLSASYVTSFLDEGDRLALGNEYDVLVGNDIIRVKLTEFVGAEGDEGVGNNSYIGALATVMGKCPLYGPARYYIVRRHQEPVCGSTRKPGQALPVTVAALLDDPIRFDLQTSIVALLTERMGSLASEAQRRAAQGR